MMETIIQISIIIAINAIWFYFYKKAIQSKINITKEYVESLKSHSEYLKKAKKDGEELTKSLEETVRLVIQQLK